MAVFISGSVDDQFVGTATVYQNGVRMGTEQVKMSAGGGMGWLIFFGYNIISEIEASLQFGSQTRHLFPEVTNAEGEFHRNYIRNTYMWRFFNDEEHGTRGCLKIGAGVGIYFPGEYVVDLSRVGGSHYSIQYKKSWGSHYMLEYEWLTNPSYVKVAFGIRYYVVQYEMTGVRIVGQGGLASSYLGKYSKLNGSGFDIYTQFEGLFNLF